MCHITAIASFPGLPLICIFLISRLANLSCVLMSRVVREGLYDIHTLICRLVGKGHHHWKLKYIDLSGCSLITDTALQRISQSLTAIPSIPPPCACANVSSYFRDGTGSGWSGDSGNWRGLEKVPQLKCLILSGCFHITDVGLRYT